jgi:hypothetical protein
MRETNRWKEFVMEERKVVVPESEITFWDRVQLLEQAIAKVRGASARHRGEAAVGLVHESFAFAHSYLSAVPEYSTDDPRAVKQVNRDREGNIRSVVERIEPGLAQLTYTIDAARLNEEGQRE